MNVRSPWWLPAGTGWSSCSMRRSRFLPRSGAQFLDRECADDPALRAEVESLLAFSGKTLQELRKPVDHAAQKLASKEDRTSRSALIA